MSSGTKKYDIDPAALDPNGIAETQSPASAASVVLNGALCDAGTALQFDIGDAYSAGIGGVRLVFDSSGDINTATFAITGKDQDGNSVTESVTGVVSTSPVSTVKYYSQVTGIVVGVATATGLFIGTIVGELSSRTIPINKHSRIPALVAVSGLDGTCVFDIQETYDDMRTVTGDSAVWFNILDDQNVNVSDHASINATAVRLVFESYTDTAELQFHVNYNAYR